MALSSIEFLLVLGNHGLESFGILFADIGLLVLQFLLPLVQFPDGTSGVVNRLVERLMRYPDGLNFILTVTVELGQTLHRDIGVLVAVLVERCLCRMSSFLCIVKLRIPLQVFAVHVAPTVLQVTRHLVGGKTVILQALDAFLGLGHGRDGSATHLDELHQFLPPGHQILVVGGIGLQLPDELIAGTLLPVFHDEQLVKLGSPFGSLGLIALDNHLLVLDALLDGVEVHLGLVARLVRRVELLLGLLDSLAEQVGLGQLAVEFGHLLFQVNDERIGHGLISHFSGTSATVGKLLLEAAPMGLSLGFPLLEVIGGIDDSRFQVTDSLLGDLDLGLRLPQVLLSLVELRSQFLEFTVGFGCQYMGNGVAADGTGLPLMQSLLGMDEQLVPVGHALDGLLQLFPANAFPVDCSGYLVKQLFLIGMLVIQVIK